MPQRGSDFDQQPRVNCDFPMQFMMFVESHKMCCKADAAQWTPLGRTAPLSEEQLYILASWPATLGNKKKGDAWKVLSVSGWLEGLVQRILISDKRGVMLRRRQMCYWYGRDKHLSVLYPPQCSRMHHHHRPHWSRTFLLNHSLCINSLVGGCDGQVLRITKVFEKLYHDIVAAEHTILSRGDYRF